MMTSVTARSAKTMADAAQATITITITITGEAVDRLGSIDLPVTSCSSDPCPDPTVVPPAVDPRLERIPGEFSIDWASLPKAHCTTVLIWQDRGVNYCREAEAPAARSRSTVRKPAAASWSETASRATVATRWGDSGRKRTLIRLWPREVMKV